MYTQFRWTKVSERRNGILRDYEPVQPYLLYNLAKSLRADMFVDVGANIGAYSLFMSHLPMVGGIHAYEASPECFMELLGNCQANHLESKITCYNQAVSNSCGQVAFGIVHEHSGANGVVSTTIHKDVDFKSQITVPCLTLDSAHLDRGRTVVLKIDVEGHESSVLEGAREFLTSNKVVVQLENYNPASNNLHELMRKYGFRLLLRVGPDHYFTNIVDQLGPEFLLETFTEATGQSIKELLEVKRRTATGPSPITVRLMPSVYLRLTNGLATRLRNLKTRIRSIIGRAVVRRS